MNRIFTLVYCVPDASKKTPCHLILETSKKQCPKCAKSMATYVPTGTDPLVIGKKIECFLRCSNCKNLIESQKIQVHATSDTEVSIAFVKAIATDLFTEAEYEALILGDFVPNEFSNSGGPIIIADGAAIDKTANISGPVLIDKYSTVGARSIIGPFVGLVNAKIDSDVELEDCRVIHTFIGSQNRIKKALLKDTVIPAGRFRNGIR